MNGVHDHARIRMQVIKRVLFAVGCACVGALMDNLTQSSKQAMDTSQFLKLDQNGIPVRRTDMPTRPYGPAPHDPGGRIAEYQSKILLANYTGTRVEIRGTCVSACTMYLGVHDVCVHPDAILWFHAAYRDSGEIDATANRMMASYWPQPVRDWANRKGVHHTKVFTRDRALSGKELIAMGVKACETQSAMK